MNLELTCNKSNKHMDDPLGHLIVSPTDHKPRESFLPPWDKLSKAGMLHCTGLPNWSGAYQGYLKELIHCCHTKLSIVLLTAEGQWLDLSKHSSKSFW